MQFPGFIDIVKQMWGFYKTKFLGLAKILGVNALAMCILILTFLGLALIVAVPIIVFKNTLLTILLLIAAGVIAIILFLYITFWITAAMYWAIKSLDETGKFSAKEAYRTTRPKVLKLWWTGFLAMLVTIGGSAIFIVPGFIIAAFLVLTKSSWALAFLPIITGFAVAVVFGIILSIWFSLNMWMVLFEDSSGIPALAKSKAFVKGHALRIFFYTLGVQLLLWLIMYVPIVILQEMNMNNISSGYSLVTQLLTWPITLIFSYLIYKAVKAEKKSVEVHPRRVIYITSAVTGVIIPFLLVGLIAWTSFQLFNTFSSWDSQNIDPNMFIQEEQEIDNYTGSEVEYF